MRKCLFLCFFLFCFFHQVLEIKKNIRKFNGFAFEKVSLRIKLTKFISDNFVIKVHCIMANTMLYINVLWLSWLIAFPKVSMSFMQKPVTCTLSNQAPKPGLSSASFLSFNYGYYINSVKYTCSFHIFFSYQQDSKEYESKKLGVER